jgi:hypothetical protein
MSEESYPNKIVLYRLPAFPGDSEIVVTNTVHSVDQLDPKKVFLLDFSRPLKKRRRFGLVVVALFVPVIHQGEEVGAFIIGCHADDPYFKDIQRFWKKYHPSTKKHQLSEAGGLERIADFATHFPAFCQ